MYIVRTDSFHLKLLINASKLANLSLKNCMQQWLMKAISIYDVNVCCRLAANFICMVKCLPQACGKYAASLQQCSHLVRRNVCGKYAAMIAASLQQCSQQRSQEAVLIWAWECLLQACRRPHLHGKMFAASLRQVCCMLAAMPLSHGIKF